MVFCVFWGCFRECFGSMFLCLFDVCFYVCLMCVSMLALMHRMAFAGVLLVFCECFGSMFLCFWGLFSVFWGLFSVFLGVCFLCVFGGVFCASKPTSQRRGREDQLLTHGG
jgi:hypothetical protein